MPLRRRDILAVVFDLDDTLILERDYVRSGFAAVGRYLRRRFGRREAFERWMWRRWCAGRREKMFDAVGQRFGLDLSAGQIASLVALYRTHRPRLRPCPGAVGLLRRLRRRGCRLGLLSDGYQPGQRLKLAAAGLGKLFDAVVLTEDFGRQAWKPSPQGFRAIQRMLSAPHSACAYVADNPAKDFLPANRLGWLTVQWQRPGQIHAHNRPPRGGKPAAVVRSPEDLVRLLQRVSRRIPVARRRSAGARTPTGP